MIQHVVLVNFRTGVPHDVRQECARRLRDLEHTVPGLKAWRVGLNVTTADRAWDMGLTAEFENLEQVAAYRNHGSHRAAQHFVDQYAEQTIGVDFDPSQDVTLR